MTQRTNKANDSPQGSERRSTEKTKNSPDPKLESIRSILFASEQGRIKALEEQTADLNQKTQSDYDEPQARIDTLVALLESVCLEATRKKERADRTQSELDELQKRFQTDSESLYPRLIANLSALITGSVQASRERMVEAPGPVMGDTIRVQIKDSRKELIEALFPIILDTVQRAISEFARTLQRNIDARFKTNFNPGGFFRTIFARLKGIPESGLILRDSLPFKIEEIFLIQHETGLLMAQKPADDGEGLDSDLVSGILTAIRDFVHDSFGGEDAGEDLDEIQYGDEKVIIQSGQFFYIAAVIKGTNPEGFRTQLRLFIHQLHVRHRTQLRDYVGDLASLPDLNGELTFLAEDFPSSEVVSSKPLSRNQRLLVIGTGLARILALARACFYFQLTIAPWPVVFGNTPTLTPRVTMTRLVVPTEAVKPSATATATASPTSSPTPSIIPSRSPSPTVTDRPTMTYNPTPKDTPEPTATAISQVTLAPVWVRELPLLSSTRFDVILAGTPLTIFSQFEPWVEGVWRVNEGQQTGWIPFSMDHASGAGTG